MKNFHRLFETKHSIFLLSIEVKIDKSQFHFFEVAVVTYTN